MLFRRFVMAVLFWLAAVSAATAEPRVALVVGNGAYTSVSGLPNPVNDANLVADVLRRSGFEVTLLLDADLPTLQRAISTFGADLREAGTEATGLFYYAGHGVQSFRRNYLLPVDATLHNAADLSLVALEAESVLRQMASARNRTNIVILDACRNNPFSDVLDLGDNGLAEMSAPTGTFLAYATGPNAVALDGVGNNSPFTEALVERIAEPGVPIEQAFKQVRVDVLDATRGLQTPWDTSSLTTDFVFIEAQELAPETYAEAQLWESVRVTGDPVQVMLFLRAYPDSEFSAEAREFLVEIMALDLNVAAAPVAEAPTPEAPAPVVPAPEEASDFALAQADGGLSAYRAFVNQYPESIFVEMASAEIAVLEAAEAAALAQAAAAAAAVVVPETQDEDAAPQLVTFTGILTTGSEHQIGRSIEELIQGTPVYPPIEGLPDELWLNQSCSNCHEWTREALCTQATVYTGDSAARSLALEHPYGTEFKHSLRDWAAGGCQ